MVTFPEVGSWFRLSFCRACYGVLRFVMESGAKGCEVGNAAGGA